MYEGLWIAQYAGMEGRDAGIVVLTQGRVLGGDNAFTYSGVYKEDGGALQATVLIQNFNASIGNVLGIAGDYTLTMKVLPSGDGILEGQGTTSLAPGFGLKVKLTRRATLEH